jgi:hypothetical protein
MPPSRSNSLKQDKGMYEWLREQSWSDFASSLASFYEKSGGLTEKQYESAKNMRMKLDDSYDPFGEDIENGVYIDEEKDLIFKLAWTTRRDFKSRSLRSRGIDSPNWRDVTNGYMHNDRDNFFENVRNGELRMLDESELIEIGRRTGICCVCGKTLDNPQSIAAGIGPYCAKQQKEKDL